MSKKKVDLKRNWVDEADRYGEEEEYVPKEKKLSPEECTDLMHLNNLRIATKRGSIDKGLPKAYNRLVAQNWAIKIPAGYQITAEGLAYIDLHRKMLRKI